MYRISGPFVRLQKIVHCWRALKLMSIDCSGNQLANLDEADFPGRKSGHGGFVGGIKNRAKRAAFAGNVVAEAKGGETPGIGGFEIERKWLGQVKPSRDAGQTLREGEGVLNGGAHVGRRKLRDYGAINELDHGMNNRLGMDEHFNLVGREAKEPAGFDEFKGLVEHGG